MKTATQKSSLAKTSNVPPDPSRLTFFSSGLVAYASRAFTTGGAVSLALFLLALIPRLLDLGRFLTPDEFLWVDRSRSFLAGLTNPAFRCTTVVEKWEFAEGLACTLRTGHPGVTTMWTGSFGLVLRWLWDGRPTALHDYVVAVSTNPLDASFIVPERLGTVLITSMWVVAVYWLVRRLWGAPVALVGAILIALDPFHIALSRVIHHDALSTTFMTLSVLCMFIYWGQQAGRRWLILSGALAGLGFLSKSPALYLMPFVALTGLWFFVRKWRSEKIESNGAQRFPLTDLLKLVADGLLWFSLALGIAVIFWPALWVIPVEAIETVFFIGSKYATGGHAKGNFFLGDISQDPGPLFYPVTWLYRTSPLVILGLLGGLGAWALRTAGRIRVPSGVGSPSEAPVIRATVSFFSYVLVRRYVPLILLFVFGYYLFMTVGEKKQDRYFLPVYPWLNFLAAAGLIIMANVRRPPTASGATDNGLRTIILVLTILIINGSLVAANYPYYLTYYNPLLGGIKSAEKAVTIGWGEGLDLAARYLNEKENAAQIRVASWYQSTFAPYYEGPAISYAAEKGKVLAGDYAVFYINQTQRLFPDEVLFDYYQSRFQPEKTISLHGVDYAWIYPSFGVDHYIQDQTYTGIASLLAWQWAEGDRALRPGQPADFELYWEYLGKKPEEAFFIRLVDAQGRLWAEGQSRPVAVENPPPTQWRNGEIIFEQGTITPPFDMPPGQYELRIGFFTNAPAVTAGELLFEIPPDEALVTVDHTDSSAAYRLPGTATTLNQSFGPPLTLLGATWPVQHLSQAQFPTTQSPEDVVLSAVTFPIDLYWRVEQPLPAATHVHVGLMDTNGEPQQAWFNLSLAETLNDSQTIWQPGDIIHTRWQLDLLPEVPAGTYHLELVWPADTNRTLSFGALTINQSGG